MYASVSCENGRSKGCGLVQFETVAEADAAIDQLNGVEFMGRNIQVREDISQKRAGPQLLRIELAVNRCDSPASTQDQRFFPDDTDNPWRRRPSQTRQPSSSSGLSRSLQSVVWNTHDLGLVGEPEAGLFAFTLLTTSDIDSGAESIA